jgi:molybdenum cofactor guanylyltransferase
LPAANNLISFDSWTCYDMSALEACILAGGLSSRMGMDKTRVRLGNRTLLGHVRAAALRAGLPVRVIRRDLVPRCGPLGGVYTGLKQSRADVIVFLSCDAPFVTTALLQRLLRAFNPGVPALFLAVDPVGFPFVVGRQALWHVERLIDQKRLSIQALAHAAGAELLPLLKSELPALLNVNTPDDLAKARSIYRQGVSPNNRQY